MTSTTSKPERVLVTGGAGYIGSFVVDDLLQKGYEVVVLDNLVYGDQGLRSFKGRKHLCFLQGDVTDAAAVDRALEGVDRVVALAAIVGDPACQVDEDLTRKINYESVKLLADKAVIQPPSAS